MTQNHGRPKPPYMQGKNMQRVANLTQPASGKDRWWETMADEIEMKQARHAVGMSGDGEGGVLDQVAKVATSFGFNFPEMQKERTELAREIAEAKDDATAARHQGDMDRLQMQFDKVQDAYEAQGNDPVRNAVETMTNEIVLDRLRPNPVEKAIQESMAAKVTEALSPASGEGIMGEVAKAAQTMKDIKELAILFNPAPAATGPAGMDPQKEYDLACKRLDMEERLEARRQDKELAINAAKASSYQDVGKILSAGIETIGRVLGEQMSLSGPHTPSSTGAPGKVPESSVPQPERDAPAQPGAQTIPCPSCQQPAIYVTPQMAELADTQAVDVVCTACGDHHTLGEPSSEQIGQAASEQQAPAHDENPIQRQRRERQEARAKGKPSKPNRSRTDPATGQELPRFVASNGGWQG